MIPPSVVRICIANPGNKKIRIWLPVVLLWPFAGLLIPLCWICIGIVWRQKEVLYIVPAIIGLICELKGLSVNVKSNAKGTKVQLQIY